MPSVGSTPTSSPSNQQQSQQQQQQAAQQQQQSTQKQQKTQPSTVQASTSQSPHTVAATSAGEASLSSSTSFSSVDTNQTLLNGFSSGLVTTSSSVNNKNRSSSVSNGTNRSYRTKYSQFMIITPAVSIDRNFDNETGAPADNDVDESCYYNGNYFRMNLINSNNESSGNDSSDSSFRSNYNSTLHNSRHHLLSNNPHGFYTFSSWRWCTLICAAMRCFGGGRSSNVPYSTSFSRRPYNVNGRSSRQRQSTFNHHLPTFTPRKTRDHMNNITYEL